MLETQIDLREFITALFVNAAIVASQDQFAIPVDIDVLRLPQHSIHSCERILIHYYHLLNFLDAVVAIGCNSAFRQLVYLYELYGQRSLLNRSLVTVENYLLKIEN